MELISSGADEPGTPTCGPFGENGVYTRSNGQVVDGTRQPFGNDFGSDVYFDAMGNSAYNSLQVTVKHTSGRFTILGSYTYGKSLDQASNLGEQVYPYNYGLTRATSSFDITLSRATAMTCHSRKSFISRIA